MLEVSKKVKTFSKELCSVFHDNNEFELYENSVDTASQEAHNLVYTLQKKTNADGVPLEQPKVNLSLIHI